MCELQALVLGVVIGAVCTGAVNLVVDWIKALRLRRAVGNGLLMEIRHCAEAGDSLRSCFDAVVENPVRVLRKAYFQEIETPLWSAACKSLSSLPRKHLPRLVAFFAGVSRINHRVRSFLIEQERLPLVYKEHEGEEREFLTSSIVQALLSGAKTNAGMCGKLAECREITDLGELPSEPAHIY